jgi:hypothetical protein
MIDGGIVTPSALAVVKLTYNSNFLGRSIGRSAGMAPLTILSIQVGPERAVGCWPALFD